ncbi:MAG: ROK family protein [Faecousia sp.]
MEQKFVCLDVGGTQIKAASIDKDGHLSEPIQYFPARSGENAETILDHFTRIIRQVSEPDAIPALRLAFPGPFDYERGICLMQGLGKYDALYGLDFGGELGRRLEIPRDTIRFANDAAAFALGELHFGAGKGAQRAMFVCIGTGCGSAFAVNGALVSAPEPGVPENGWIYPTPFLEGQIDDYLSRRGLLALTQAHLGEALDGKALAQRTRSGEKSAGACFREFGVRLRDALSPFLDGFHPEVLCLGGQIMKSGDLFLEPLETACRERGIRLAVTEDTSVRTLQGLTRV